MQVPAAQQNFTRIKACHFALWEDALQRFQSTRIVFIISKRRENNCSIRHHKIYVACRKPVANIPR
ncbi:hypothetical protein ATCV1_z811L [Acanthocystis turfacea chlorella virus 1]|uniref:Uncharacterized protein z811L n=1 Tax=Chlorovirus heliozoae TaxID=322019 RepID=A7KA71_9PHYC|nr:hypothetical protein ATCV1_z811L [Acanthocystis turfacea chlorella virus 1]ABT16945.1 hypothetical protein ATCV1_z811L [Acanthocystis turfacea chlorella virus 1]